MYMEALCRPGTLFKREGLLLGQTQRVGMQFFESTEKKQPGFPLKDVFCDLPTGYLQGSEPLGITAQS